MHFQSIRFRNCVFLAFHSIMYYVSYRLYITSLRVIVYSTRSLKKDLFEAKDGYKSLDESVQILLIDCYSSSFAFTIAKTMSYFVSNFKSSTQHVCSIGYTVVLR